MLRSPRPVVPYTLPPSERRRALTPVLRCLIWSEPPELSETLHAYRCGRLSPEQARAMPRQHLERCLQGLPPPAQQSRWDQTVRRREPMQFRKQAPCGEFHQSGCRVKPKPAAGPPDAIAARDPSAVSRQGVQSGDAHIGAGRPAELFHHRWFKGQQRQYVIHIGPHGSRAAGRHAHTDGQT